VYIIVLALYQRVHSCATKTSVPSSTTVSVTLGISSGQNRRKSSL